MTAFVRLLGLLVRRDVSRLVGSERSFFARAIVAGFSLLPFVGLLAAADDLARLGQAAHDTVRWMHRLLIAGVWVSAPALGATAIREEAETGSLDLLRMAGFRPGQIVTAKALAVTLLLLVVGAAVIPLLGLGVVLGGVEPSTLAGLPMGIAFLGLFGASLGVATGAAIRTTVGAYGSAQVILASGAMLTYAMAAALDEAVLPGSATLISASPFTGPASRLALPELVLVRDVALAAAGVALPSALLLLYARHVTGTLGLRDRTTAADQRRRLGILPRTRRDPAFRGPLGTNPVLWRERNVARLRYPWLLGLGVTLAILVLAFEGAMPFVDAVFGLRQTFETSAAMLGGLGVFTSYAVVSLINLRAFGEEKRTRAFVPVAATPMPIRRIVAGKVLGPLPWVAALAAPWFVHLIARILRGDAPLVASLVGAACLVSMWAFLGCLGAACSLKGKTESRAMLSFLGFWMASFVVAPAGWALTMLAFTPIMLVESTDPSLWLLSLVALVFVWLLALLAGEAAVGEYRKLVADEGDERPWWRMRGGRRVRI